MNELIERFGYTADRRKIIEGLLDLRKELFSLGFGGFQWIDGSFVTKVESIKNSSPNDADVVTWAYHPDGQNVRSVIMSKPYLCNPQIAKQKFKIDHYMIPLYNDALTLIQYATYWYGLFSHTRERIWKGIVAVALDSLENDNAARNILGASK